MTHFARQSLFGTGAESGARYMEPKWLTFESQVLRKKKQSISKFTAAATAAALVAAVTQQHEYPKHQQLRL